MNPRRLVLIVGRTGVGKSTVSTSVGERLSLPVLHFHRVGMSVAASGGYARLRNMFQESPLPDVEFRLTRAICDVVDQALHEAGTVIFEGLIVHGALAHLLDMCDETHLVAMKASTDVRRLRIGGRLGVTGSLAAEEDVTKGEIKSALGLETLLARADFEVDANSPFEEVVRAVVDVIEDLLESDLST